MHVSRGHLQAPATTSCPSVQRTWTHSTWDPAGTGSQPQSADIKLAILSLTRGAHPAADLPHSSVGTAAALLLAGGRSGDGPEHVTLEVTLGEALRTEPQFGHSPLHFVSGTFLLGPVPVLASSVLQLELLPGDTHKGSPELRWRASLWGSLKDIQTLHSSQLWFREIVGKRNLWNTKSVQRPKGHSFSNRLMKSLHKWCRSHQHVKFLTCAVVFEIQENAPLWQASTDWRGSQNKN